jgi:hypothetical protein
VPKNSLRTVLNQKHSVHTVATHPPVTFLLILSYQGLPCLIYHLRATWSGSLILFDCNTVGTIHRVTPFSCKFHTYSLQ